jgi:hypothetical protein
MTHFTVEFLNLKTKRLIGKLVRNRKCLVDDFLK